MAWEKWMFSGRFWKKCCHSLTELRHTSRTHFEHNEGRLFRWMTQINPTSARDLQAEGFQQSRISESFLKNLFSDLKNIFMKTHEQTNLLTLKSWAERSKALLEGALGDVGDGLRPGEPIHQGAGAEQTRSKLSVAGSEMSFSPDRNSVKGEWLAKWSENICNQDRWGTIPLCLMCYLRWARLKVSKCLGTSWGQWRRHSLLFFSLSLASMKLWCEWFLMVSFGVWFPEAPPMATLGSCQFQRLFRWLRKLQANEGR